MIIGYHVLCILFLFTYSTQCAVINPLNSELKIADLSPNTAISDSSLETTSCESTESLKSCTPVLTYRTLMHRLKLKNMNSELLTKEMFDEVAKAKLFARIIIRNFSEAHFYGFNTLFYRNYPDDLEVKDRFNDRILYHLMQDSEALNLLGYRQCLLIIEGIIQTFESYVRFDSRSDLSIRYESIAIQLVDFLEFILNEMIPKYAHKRCDPEYKLQDHCEMEYPAFLHVDGLITTSIVAKFRNADFFRVLVRRFAPIWPRSSTEAIIIDSLICLGESQPFLFREVLTLMVRQAPEYFLHPDQITKYGKKRLTEYTGLSQFLFHMAPIFRALMLIDSEEVTLRYLESYFRPHVRAMFDINQKRTLEALNVFIQDSKFAIVTSKEITQRKMKILQTIISVFFDIKIRNYFRLAYYCLSKNLLPLYEVVLQYFSDHFDMERRRDLLLLIVRDLRIENSMLATAITMSYLDFGNCNDFKPILEQARALSKYSEQPRHTKLGKQQLTERKKRYRSIKEIYELLAECPLKDYASFMTVARVPWPCSETVRIAFPIDDCGTVPKLYFYAQVILCNRLGIPFYGGSVFESTMDEAASWNEMIGFINLNVEKMISLVGRHGEEGFKFLDTTDYSRLQRLNF